MTSKIYIFGLLSILVFAGTLFADTPGPYASMTQPLPASWSGCTLQVIKVVIKDSTDNIDTSSIEIRVAGLKYDWGDTQLEWDGDSVLTFTPDSVFSNNDTVLVELLAADDIDGNPLQGAPRSWKFYIDLDFPYFVASTRHPSPDETVCDDVDSIAIKVVDTTSGIPFDGVCMCFNSYWFTCPDERSSGFCWQPTVDTNIVYRDSIFFIRWSHLINNGYFNDEDSIEVCLRKAVDKVGVGAPDIDAVCGPHWFDTTDTDQCWSFLRDCEGPRSLLVFPSDNDTFACDSIVIRFVDYSAIDTTNIQIFVTGGGIPYISTSDVFNANSTGDTAFYIGNLPEGTVAVHIIRTRDLEGNWRTSHPWWYFYVDKTPPIVSNLYPPNNGVTATSIPLISLDISDVRTKVDSSSLELKVDGTTYDLSDAALSWDGATLEFSSSVAGISFSHNDTVKVCLNEACDIVKDELCGPNCIEIPYCWEFTIDIVGPNAELVSPPESTYSACDDQGLILRIFDSNGVDSFSIVLDVDSVTYDSLNNFTYRNDTLVFTPPFPWTDGQSVYWELKEAKDLYGNPLSTLISGIFFIDLSPPEILDIKPAEWTIFGPSYITCIFEIVDSGAGVDPSTAEINVNGHTYSYPVGFTWDGLHLSFDLCSTGLSFTEGETVLVCLEIGDSIDSNYCGPNIADTCIRYTTDLQGPFAEMLFPPDSSVTACYDSIIKIIITDPNKIDTTSIEISIDGVTYTLDSSEVVLRGDTVIYRPSTAFSHGDTVNVEILAAKDTLGNPIDSGYAWTFLVDIEPPILTNYFPLNGEAIASASPTIRMWLEDSPAGVDTLSISIRINGILFHWSSAGMSWSSGIMIFSTADVGLTFGDAETVEVCLVSVTDMVPISLCGANAYAPDSCWKFTIDLMGPASELILPDDGSYSSCDSQEIRVRIFDREGIFADSTAIRINDDTLRAWLGELVTFGDTAIYIPTSAFNDGEVVEVQVVLAVDLLGNRSTSGDIWEFTIDISLPVWFDTDPPPDTFLSSATPVITLGVIDSLSTVDTTTFTVRVNSTGYTGTDPGISYTTPYFTLNLGAMGFSFSDGDTMEFCFDSVADYARYCGKNYLYPDSCFNYYIDLSGPVAQLVFPDSGAFFGCRSGTLMITITDNFAVDTTSIRLSVDGITYSLSHSELWFSGDTLYFTPSTPFEHGDTIVIQLTNANDLAGNTLTSGGPWNIIIDLEGPEITSIVPPSGSFLISTSDTITATIEDSGAGVDSSSLRIYVADTLVSIGYFYNSTTGEIVFIPNNAGFTFSSGESLRICFGSSDLVKADYCGPNIGDTTCATYIFDLEGPIASYIEPFDSAYTSCDDQKILIKLIDDFAVATASINLRVNGVNYVIIDPELTYTDDSLLVFTPSSTYPEGEITVTLWGVVDHVGNAMDSDSLVFIFFTDYSPPYITSISPLGGNIFTATPTFEIGLADVGAGIFDSSIVISLNGIPLSLSSGCLEWDDSIATLTPLDCGISFEDGDTLRLCIRAKDKPDFCSSNEMTYTCWNYIFSTRGPAVTVIEPLDGVVSACEDQGIIFKIIDGNGVDASTIVLSVNGTDYDTTESELTFHDDTLRFTPSTDWSDGDTVIIILKSADDMLGVASPDVPETVVYYIDLSPPYVDDVIPPAMTAFASGDSIITIILIDDIAGVNPFSIILSIGGLDFTYPSGDMNYSNDSLTFSVTGMGYIPFHKETLKICIEAMDKPAHCMPHMMDPYCFKYYYDLRDPIVMLYFPLDSVWTSCYDSISWRLYDDYAIDSTSILISVGGDTCDLSSSMLTFHGGELLRFQPDTGLVEGEMIAATVIHVEDIAGNAVGPKVFWVGFDTTGPVASNPYPPAETLITTISTSISVDVIDNASGLEEDSLFMVIDGDTFTYHSGDLSWDGTKLTADSESLGVHIDSNDTIFVCVGGLYDRATICGVNIGDSLCWRFFVDAAPPEPELISPPDSVFMSCDRETIVVVLRDPHGIDWTFVRFNVRGSEVSITTAGVSITGDSMFTFIPTFSIADGETVEYYLTMTKDTLGNLGTDYPHWFFYVDRSPPYVLWEEPVVGDFLGDTWHCGIFDDFAGVDTSSIEVTINSIIVSRTISIDTVFVDISSISVSDGDTVNICISAADLVEWCDPNEMDIECFEYIIDLTPPLASLIYPDPGAISACDDQGAAWLISEPFGIDTSSIIVIFEDETLDVTDPKVTYTEDMLKFEPGILSDGDTIQVSLLCASDLAGNVDTFNLSTWYVIDLTPPYITSTSPADSSTIADPTPSIVIGISDDIAGVDSATIVITINGDTVEFIWDGTSVRIFCDSIGIEFADSDTVIVCISAADMVDLCDSNYMDDTCFTFDIDISGPLAVIIEPGIDEAIACDSALQRIVMYLFDEDDVDSLSILFVVDSETLKIDSTELTYRNDTLIYIPPIPWDICDTICVSLIEAEDLLGNGLVEAISWCFIVDLEPPLFYNPVPREDSIVSSLLGGISIDIIDSCSGVSSSSIRIWIEGFTDTFAVGSGLLWHAPTATVPGSLVSYLSGTLTVCARASDNTRLCGPNTDSTCWTFIVESEGPTARPITPLPGQIISCRDGDQRILIYLHDDDSIDICFTDLLINDSSVSFTYSSDTVLYEPSTAWRHHDTIHVALISRDLAGNWMTDTMRYWFVVDTAGPYFAYTLGSANWISPAILTHYCAAGYVEDIPAGVDRGRSMVDMHLVDYNGHTADTTFPPVAVGFLIWLCIDDSWLTDAGIDTAGTLSLCFHLWDKAELCGANRSDTCLIQLYDPYPPVLVEHFPSDYAISSCPDSAYAVLDDYLAGVWDSICAVYINGDSVAHELSPAGTLTWVLPAYSSGDTFEIEIFIGDSVYNDTTYFIYSVADTSPPVAFSESPPTGSSVLSTTPNIALVLVDSVSGVDEGTIIIVIYDDTLTVDSMGVTFSDDTLKISTLLAGLSFALGETVSVCVNAGDSPDICDTNYMSSYCWDFRIREYPGPEASLLFPEFSLTIISCTDTAILLLIQDIDGIAESTIVFVVNGDTLTTDSTELYFSNDTLRYYPLLGSSWDTVTYELVAAEDIFGFTLENKVGGTIIFDLDPPVAFSPSPSHLSTVVIPTPDIIVILIDSISGMDSSSIFIVVNGDSFTIDSTGVTFADDTLKLSTLDAGLSFSSDDSVHVCVSAKDMPDYCSPNEMVEYCWDFIVLIPDGPLGELIFPSDTAIIMSCVDTALRIYLWDYDTVVDSTIRLVVNSKTFTVDSTELSYSDDTLRFYPLSGSSGDTINYWLSRAEDRFGNPLESTIRGYIVLDYDPPMLINWLPETASVSSPTLQLILVDSISGVDWGTFEFIIGLTTLDTSSAAVSVSGDTVLVNFTTAGILLPGIDTTIRIIITDSPDLCDSNVLDTSLTLSVRIPGENPEAILISPPNNSIISCDGGNIKFYLEDSDRILPESLGVYIGDTLRLVYADSPPELTLIGDTLLFNAPGSFEHGDTLRITPLGCDSHYYPVLLVTWQFIIDLFAPTIEFLEPDSLTPLYDSLAQIIVRITDEPAGVNEDSILITVQTPRGNWILTTDSSGVNWDGLLLTVDPYQVNHSIEWTIELDSSLLYFHENETNYVIQKVCDKAILCGNNCTSDSFSFFTADDDTLPPSFTVPDTTVYPGQLFQLIFIAWDSSGIGEPCTYAIVNGMTLWIDIQAEGDSFILTVPEVQIPSFGETLTIEIHLCDDDQDFMREEDRSDTSFVVEIIPLQGEGPLVRFIQPLDSDYVSCIDGPILLLVQDDDGIDTSSLVLDGDYTVSWHGDTTYIYSDSAWNHGDTVAISVVEIYDIWGNSGGVDSMWFIVDFVPPVIELISPPEGMIEDVHFAHLRIVDDLAGIWSAYAYSETDSFELDEGDNNISLDDFDVVNDTLRLRIRACDRSLYCGANCTDTTFYFIPYFTTKCAAHPIPITPNNDNINDRLYFDYPDMLKTPAKAIILTTDGVIVREMNLSPALPSQNEFWDGKYTNGENASTGIYIYLIIVDDAVICKGTIVVAR